MLKSSQEIAQIVRQDEKECYHFDANLLKHILLRSPELADMQVAVVSVAGAFRKGKSFLLNFIYRFLTHDGQDGWLEADGSILDGFTWHCGHLPNTKGIFISSPFIITRSNGDKLAVLLMDTQGLFDHASTTKDNSTIFALSILCSSVQVLNFSQNINAKDLLKLVNFCDYGIHVLDTEKCTQIGKPFQKLVFLIRDWQYGEQYGFEGGDEYLRNVVLRTIPGQHSELKKVRENIREVFEDVSLFLMPYPGKEVASSPTFKGELDKIDSKFLHELKTFVSTLLDPDALKPKTINGQPLTCSELFYYFVAYFDILQSGILPEPMSIIEANARANQKSLVEISMRKYEGMMNLVINASNLTKDELEYRHREALNNALILFKEAKKMGDEELTQNFLAQLKREIQDLFMNHYLFAFKTRVEAYSLKQDAENEQKEMDMMVMQTRVIMEKQMIITRTAQKAAVDAGQEANDMKRDLDNTIIKLNEIQKQRELDNTVNEIELKELSDKIEAQAKAIADLAKEAREREMDSLKAKVDILKDKLEETQKRLESARNIERIKENVTEIIGGIVGGVAGFLTSGPPGMITGAVALSNMMSNNKK